MYGKHLLYAEHQTIKREQNSYYITIDRTQIKGLKHDDNVWIEVYSEHKKNIIYAKHRKLKEQTSGSFRLRLDKHELSEYTKGDELFIEVYQALNFGDMKAKI